MSFGKVLRRSGYVALPVLLLILAAALLGPYIAPYSPTAITGRPVQLPSTLHWFGTDSLGRDVFSRVLNGGAGLLLMAAASTFLSYAMGIPLGMAAAVGRKWVDNVLMRIVDVLIALPALMVLLVLLTAVGTANIPALVVGTAIVRVPAIARVTRAATQETLATEFVEAAMARGERLGAILYREVLPNIGNVIFSMIGLNFTASALIVASLNFLGVGLQPPSSDWGLMVAENRSIFHLNPMSVLGAALMLGALTVAISQVWDNLRASEGSVASPELDVVKGDVQ